MLYGESVHYYVFFFVFAALGTESKRQIVMTAVMMMKMMMKMMMRRRRQSKQPDRQDSGTTLEKDRFFVTLSGPMVTLIHCVLYGGCLDNCALYPA